MSSLRRSVAGAIASGAATLALVTMILATPAGAQAAPAATPNAASTVPVISTTAGTGLGGYSGDGRAATVSIYVSVLCWTLGNFSITYLTLLTARGQKRYDLVWAALLVPIYWVMMSIAAAKAVFQLIVTPSFWEKTVHGLRQEPAAAPPESPRIGSAWPAHPTPG